MTIRRTLLAVLAAAAFIAPTANAMPADMHASTAQAAAQARGEAQAKQDLRSPDARDAGQRPHASDQVPPAGQPTWPVHPTTLAPPAQEPVTDDGGAPVPVLPLAAGALVALIAALTARHVARRGSRPRIAA